MKIALLAFSVALSLFSNALQNAFGKSVLKTLADCLAFNCLISLAATAVLLATGGVPRMPSLFTLLLGIVFGLVTALSLVAHLSALSSGPMSYTVLIGSCSMLIPTFAGVLFWRETVHLSQVLGVALLVLAFYIGVNPKKDSRITGRWLLFCSLAFLSSGAVGVMQKVHQSSSHRGELNLFLVIAFLTSTAAMALLLPAVRRQGEVPAFRLRSRFSLMALACGVCTGLIHKINLYLSGVMPSILFFPLVNGCTILLAAVVANIVFHERPTRRQVASLLIGVAAVALVGNAAALLFPRAI